jgi:hypothetical protein
MSAGDFLTMFMTCSRSDCADTVKSLQTKVFAEQNSQEYGNGGGEASVVGIKMSL